MVTWHRLARAWSWAEDASLVGLLSALILLAVFQMLARNLFAAGWPWVDPLTRILVLWVGLVGAMIALREHKHIAILVARERLPRWLRDHVAALAHLLTAVTSATLAYQSIRLVQIEAEFPVVAFLGVPTWACQTIMPLAFAVIALRSLAAVPGALRTTHEAAS